YFLLPIPPHSPFIPYTTLFRSHWRRGGVDLKMGLVLTAGGLVGSFAGAWVFKVLQTMGQVDLVISLAYVLFLTIIGGLMLMESRSEEHTSELQSRENIVCPLLL